MKLLKVVAKGNCEFCGKEHEVTHVQLENNRIAILCWKDLQKLARMNLKETSNVDSAKRS